MNFLTNHPDLTDCFYDISNLYHSIGNKTASDAFLGKCWKNFKEKFCSTDLYSSTSGNVAQIYNNVGDNLEQQEFHEDDSLSDGSLLGKLYSNIGEVYNDIGNYSKAHQIYEKVLSSDHLKLATSYNSISGVYERMGDYSKALDFYKNALTIQQKSLPSTYSLIK